MNNPLPDLSVLGPLTVQVAGAPVQITAAKQRALLALLALHPRTVLPATRMIDLLWGDPPPATAAKNLQVLVGRLREVLEPRRAKGEPGRVIVQRDDGYMLDLPDDAFASRRFSALVSGARTELAAGRAQRALAQVDAALALWRGDPLGDLGDESWARPHGVRLAEERMRAIELRLECCIEVGQADVAIGQLEVLVAEHPYRERLRALQMRALYCVGRQPEALAVYRDVREVLDTELGIEPDPELRELERAILRHDPALKPSALSKRITLPAPPVPRTSLVGRDHELAELAHWLIGDDDTRIVSITGWGGVGKTRVATEVSRRVAASFEAVAFIELSSVTSPDLVVGAVEAAFGITGTPDPTGAAIAQSIGSRRMLLVLDNFEHVLDAAPFISSIVAACEHLVVLVTSRTRLGIHGEHEFPLHAFAVPDGDQLANQVDIALQLDAVQLFMARAHAAGVDTAQNPESVRTVAAVCARVDGLPLGIELAAARVKLLSPAQILERLDDRLSLLTTRDIDVPDRQRSLRAAIEWSHGLLDETERQVFRSLAVCDGGCSVELALAILDGDVTDPVDVLESLVDKGLLTRVYVDGSTRLSMLETIAEYARELLAADDQADRVRARHAAHLLQLARAADTFTSTEVDQAARHRVAGELPNLRRALAWSVEHDPERAGQLVAHLERYFAERGSSEEGLAWAGRANVHADRMTPPTRARLLVVTGMLEHRTGDQDRAASNLAAALELFEQQQDLVGQASVESAMGDVNFILEQFDESTRNYERAIELAQDGGNEWHAAVAANNLGGVKLDLDEFDEAERLFSYARSLFKAVGDDAWTADVQANLSYVEMMRGRPLEAIAIIEPVLDIHESLGSRRVLAQTRSNVARMYLEVPDHARARELLDLALPDARDAGDVLILCHALSIEVLVQHELGDPNVVSTAREGLECALRADRFRYVMFPIFVLAALSFAQQDWERAIRLWSMFTEEDMSDGLVLDRTIMEVRAGQLDALRAAVGVDRFDELWNVHVSLDAAQRTAKAIELSNAIAIRSLHVPH